MLAFRQNATIQPFGDKFTSGSTYPAAAYTFNKYITVDIIVYKLGIWTSEDGFKIRNSQGAIVF